MIQSGFNILDLMNPIEAVYKTDNKVKDLFNKVSLSEVIRTADISRNFFQILKVFL